MPKIDKPLVSMTQKKGIVIGNHETLATVDISMYNNSMNSTFLLSLETTFSIDFNFTMKDVVFYPVFNNATIKNTKVLKHNIPVEKIDFDKALQNVV